MKNSNKTCFKRLKALALVKIARYGFVGCVCCGCIEFEKLSINHLFPYWKGTRPEKEAGIPLYYKVINDECAYEKYNILCINCNTSEYHKRIDKTVCVNMDDFIRKFRFRDIQKEKLPSELIGVEELLKETERHYKVLIEKYQRRVCNLAIKLSRVRSRISS